jgi:hypothetical protein
MRIQSKLFLIFLISAIYFSCTPDPNHPEHVDGFVPVYSNNVAYVKTVAVESARPMIHGGKIYTVGNLLFQVEQDSGIHVIDYGNPSNPVKLGFIRSFLCKEVTVKNGFIYTNNMSDLVVIDMNNINNLHEVSRVKNVFPDLALQYPPKSAQFAKIFFECPDPSKGVIIGWVAKNINNPKCWR